MPSSLPASEVSSTMVPTRIPAASNEEEKDNGSDEMKESGDVHNWNKNVRSERARETVCAFLCVCIFCVNEWVAQPPSGYAIKLHNLHCPG